MRIYVFAGSAPAGPKSVQRAQQAKRAILQVDPPSLIAHGKSASAASETVLTQVDAASLVAHGESASGVLVPRIAKAL